jgi:hypothetical protein
MRASVALPSTGSLVEQSRTRIARGASLAERRRWWIVALCALVQSAFVAYQAHAHVVHNGWLFQNGDDGPWYWTTAWAMTSLHTPYAAVGPGWPYLLTPLAAIFGPNMANGLPAVIALNLLVLAPAAVVGMYLVGERIAGRLFGVWTAALWTLMPALGVALYDSRHRTFLVDFFLPTGLGLNALSDYAAMVCAIFCAYLVLRAVDANRLQDGLLAGILLGFLVLIKPANGPLPVAAVVLLGVTLRFRALAGTIVAAIPAAIALVIWKRTGTGVVPAFSGGGGGGGGGGGATSAAHNAHKYLNIDFQHIAVGLHDLKEVFWSFRLLEFLLIAGSIGLITRARWKGVFVVAWFVGFALVKGGVSYSNVYDTSLYRFLLPAWPAWSLIVAGVILCWPSGLAARAARRTAELTRARELRAPGWPVVIAAAAVFAVAPFLLIAALSPAKPGAIIDENFVGAPIPVVDFGLAAHQTGPHSMRLSWQGRTTPRAKTTYAIFKAADDGCGQLDPAHPLCRFKMQLIGTSHSTAFMDTQAVTHRLYRVGLVAGSTVQVDNPSLLLMSKTIGFTPR